MLVFKIILYTIEFHQIEKIYILIRYYYNNARMLECETYLLENI